MSDVSANVSINVNDETLNEAREFISELDELCAKYAQSNNDYYIRWELED